MQWKQIREKYPNKWILVEAIKAHTESNKRIIEQLTVIDSYIDVSEALCFYKQLHKKTPDREYYVVHTDNDNLEIYERKWVGIRKSYENNN